MNKKTEHDKITDILFGLEQAQEQLSSLTSPETRAYMAQSIERIKHDISVHTSPRVVYFVPKNEFRVEIQKVEPGHRIINNILYSSRSNVVGYHGAWFDTKEKAYVCVTNNYVQRIRDDLQMLTELRASIQQSIRGIKEHIKNLPVLVDGDGHKKASIPLSSQQLAEIAGSLFRFQSLLVDYDKGSR